MTDLADRLALLDRGLRDLGSVLVAFSGGADSAFLLAAAVRSLGTDRVVAATAVSASLAAAELPPARAYAASLGVRHVVPGTDELARPGYVANGADRCFHCKATLLDTLRPLAAELGLAGVATGTNADDLVAGFRPGHPGGGRARRRHAAGRRRAHQGRRAGGEPAVGPGHRRQAGARLPGQPDRVRRAGDPSRLARVDRAETALRAHLGRRSSTCGCATSAWVRPGSSSTRGARPRATRRPSTWSAPRASPRSAPGSSARAR